MVEGSVAGYVTGVLAVVVMAVGWVAVQGAWRRVFPDAFADPDVLAGRTSCQGCDDAEGCDRRGCAGSGEEELR